MLSTSLNLPPLSRSVSEPATADQRLRTLLGVTYTIVDEPETLTGLHVEGFGVVGHHGDPTGAVQPVSTWIKWTTMAEIRTGGRGRRPRVTRAELRSMLLEAALEILREEGLQTGSMNITFKRVCDRVLVRTGIQVTNASVIKRIWENQAEFQADVLVAVANDQSRPELGLIFNALGPLLEEAVHSNPESRARLVNRCAE